MKRIFGVLAVATLALAGCPKDNGNNVKLDGGQDLRMNATGDMTMTAKAANGEPCTKAADCTGNFCFTEAQGFQDGMCSKTCVDSNSCDDGESCVNFGSTIGRKCIPDCDAPDSCRDGYSCWIGWNCLPELAASDEFPLCDPTANNTCGAGKACQRAVHNDGSAGQTGVCVNTCTLGVGTCGADDECILFSNAAVLKADAAALTDVYTNDKGIYTSCLGFTLGADAVANNAVCLAESTAGDGFKYSYACVDGSQCALPAADKSYSDDYGPGVTGGDSKCYTLCYEAGQAPVVNPDAGVEGTPFTTCPASTTCKNAFGLFGNTAGNAKVGLCQP